MWISVWITFNKNSNDYYYCFRTSQRLCFMPICIRHMPLTPASSSRSLSSFIQVAKIHNIQVTPKTYNNTILLWYVSMWGCIYIIFHRDFYPRVGMCSTHTPTSKLYQIFTQFNHSPQIHFDSHFDKILKIQAKINFLTI